MTYKVIAKHDNRAETLHRESDSIEELYAQLEDEGYVVYFIEQEKQNEEYNEIASGMHDAVCTHDTNICCRYKDWRRSIS